MATPDDDMPEPGLVPAFVLQSALAAPVGIGRLATGGRRFHVALGTGALRGRDLDGTILAGSETWLERPDGVTVVELSAIVRTADGGTLRLIGTGYRTTEPFAGTRLSLVFEPDEDSAHAWLSTRAFVAERPQASDALAIHQIT